MTISLNSDTTSLFAQQALSDTQKTLAQSIKSLSSGKRVNGAQDDAVSLAISQSLISQMNGVNQSVQNLSDATNLLQSTDSALSNIQSILLNIKTLAVQAADPTLSRAGKLAITSQLQDLNNQINSTANQSNQNGNYLLAKRAVFDSISSGLKVGTQLGNLDDTEVTAIHVDGSAAAGVYTFTANGATSINLNQIDLAGNVIATQSVSYANNVGKSNTTNFSLNFDKLGVAIDFSTKPLTNAVGAVDNPSILASNLANIFQPIVVTNQNQDVAIGAGNGNNYLNIGAIDDTTQVENKSLINNTQLASSSNRAVLNASANNNATDGVHAVNITQTAQASQFTIVGFNSPTDTVSVNSSTFWLAVGSNVYFANGTTWKNASVTTSGDVTSVALGSGTQTTGNPTLGAPGGGSVTITDFAKWVDNQNDALSVAVNQLSGGASLEFKSAKTGLANAIAFSNLGNVAYQKDYATGQTIRGGINLSASGRFGQATGAAQGGGYDYFLGQQNGNQQVAYDAGFNVWGTQTIEADGTANAGFSLNNNSYTYLISMTNGNIAQDAKGTIDGRAFDSATNVFTDGTSGLNLYINANIPKSQGPSSPHPVTANANVTVTSGSDQPPVNGKMQALGNTIINNLSSVLNSGNEADWQSAVNQLSTQADSAIDLISSQRSTLGSQMNQVAYISSNLSAQANNLQGASSGLVDTNYASTTADLVKGQISQQAGVQMLKDANNFPSMLKALMKEWGNSSSVG